jgi:hypothetical protein
MLTLELLGGIGLFFTQRENALFPGSRPSWPGFLESRAVGRDVIVGRIISSIFYRLPGLRYKSSSAQTAARNLKPRRPFALHLLIVRKQGPVWARENKSSTLNDAIP